MRPDERLVFAQLAYERAVTLVAHQSTPATWRRLLAAASSFRTAIRDEQAWHWAEQARAIRITQTKRKVVDALADPPASAVFDVGSRPPDPGLLRASELLAAECERSSALRTWSLRLIDEARVLIASLAEVAAERTRTTASAG